MWSYTTEEIYTMHVVDLLHVNPHSPPHKDKSQGSHFMSFNTRHTNTLPHELPQVELQHKTHTNTLPHELPQVELQHKTH